MTRPTKAPAKASRPAFLCDACGYQPPKWVGRCPECGEWGSVVESAPAAAAPVALRQIAPRMPGEPARPIAEISPIPARAVPTHVSELDRVLGGGLVPGGVVLLAGEPGVGKSTLLLDVAQQWAVHSGSNSLVVSGEESVSQVRLRAERMQTLHERLYLAAETDLAALLGHVDAVRPGLLIVDSVQTVSSPTSDGVPGGVTQVRAVTAALIATAKERGIATILVGHVTKDGNVAGPRVLEHLVDVVLQFEGDKHSSLRLIRGLKNRFGSVDEVGCFEMHETGIASLPDPSGLFLTRHAEPVPGTCCTVVMEGRRALVTEVQALIGASPANGSPRRTVSGLDSARLAMLLAVLERRGPGKGLHEREVFASTVGGIKVTEPSVDLAMALAIASAKVNLATVPNLVAVGEVGLTGEIRRVGNVAQRLAEAARLGFTVALVPVGCAPAKGTAPTGLKVHEVGDLPQALQMSALLAAERTP
ncbi:DNA repair protein RadA [Hamadaea sp. NPDC050747]|uniref:DNA repair protein RadA n=1 Tax=Hamadaea sp. NPDC050747 TaxID=3155789 RepID=UPI0033CF34AF